MTCQGALAHGRSLCGRLASETQYTDDGICKTYCKTHAKMSPTYFSREGYPWSAQKAERAKILEDRVVEYQQLIRHTPDDWIAFFQREVFQPPPTDFPKDIKLAEECQICLEKPLRLVLGCRHVVCSQCISKIKTCPICRQEIQISLVKSL